MGKKYVGSFAKVVEGKTATFGYELFGADTLQEFAKLCLRRAWIPVTVERGHRTYDAVKTIHNWLRFDCDAEGEMETITSILESNGLAYMCLPSTNYNSKTKAYKWHISVPCKKVSQDVVKYKWQMKRALIDLGIDLRDRRVTEVCVQNFNPYQNGKNPIKGFKYCKFHNGVELKLKKAPKELRYSAMTKTVFNGKGVADVIAKKVVSVKGSVEVLHPDSGIKIDKVGWVQLKDLNLDVGGMIGGLSCPSHNHKHNNGKGGHQCGYAFATMDEGGDVWINCTGVECRGRYYKVDLCNYGANTKLSDLYELRKAVSLSGYNHKDNKICFVKDNGSIVHFRWKDVLKYWNKDIFFKLDMSLTEENFIEKKKIEDKLENLDMEKPKAFQKKVKLTKKLNKLSLKNEYDVIAKALGNEKKFEAFKNKYKPIFNATGEVDTYPHQLYMEDVINNVGTYIETTRQFDNIEYKIDPFALHLKGDVLKNRFTITSNKVLPSLKIGSYNKVHVADYLEHNPYLHDILNMIMAQRYGADRKSSYLWLKAESNWGKSFLFDGVLGSIGYLMTESELKNTVNGGASGVSANDISRASFLFFDEVKGVVGAFKNIVDKICINEKFKTRSTVEVFMKILCSAEHLPSLKNDLGMDAQFSNRFLYIEAKGSLVDRPIYKSAMFEYKESIIIYVLQYLYKLKNKYDAMGRSGALRLAHDTYSALQETYSIKNNTKDILDTLPALVKDWLALVNDRELGGVNTNIEYIYKDSIKFTTSGDVFVLNMAKAKELFINEMLTHNARNIVKHKTFDDIFGENTKSSTRVGTIKMNARKIKLS